MIDPLYLAKSEEYLNNSPFKTSVITLIPIVKIYNNNICIEDLKDPKPIKIYINR